jgi:manganese transport protein
MSSVENASALTPLADSRGLLVRWRERLRRLLPFLGPAFLVSVGYMDPGNWGTDIDGGSRFGYQLLWVILLSNMMAILLQTLSAKLGIATGRTLPQLCRDNFSKPVNLFLWVTAEIAAMATDLAEFLGAALGLYLLFGIPMFPAALLSGVIISAILALEQFGHRKLEKVIIGLVAVIGFAYIIEILMSKPDVGSLLSGMLIPRLNQGSILVAVGIIGATVMPHNLYLHSALVQPRRDPTDAARNKYLYKMSKVDSLIALNGAWLVNSAILIMSAATFSSHGLAVATIEVAHQTLTPLLGGLSAFAFAIALLASGLASSTTATMAGQVIIEGFLHRRVNIWARRLVTMIPSLIVIGLGVDPLRVLILSQVSLSFQLPFAMIPLIKFTRDRKIMGDYANSRLVNGLAYGVAAIILSLNVWLITQVLNGSL